MARSQLKDVLLGLPKGASEAIVKSQFVAPFLLEALGFSQDEVCPEYSTGTGNLSVDYAARKNSGSDNIFTHTQSNPYLLIELKGRETSLCENSAKYKSTLKQLNTYLLDSNCKSAQWGLITNSDNIQLFRKHGKVIHPATSCLSLNPDNADETIKKIRAKLDKPQRALTVAVYNNKGGVGKTTTTINLAAVLALAGKKVLAVDFDPNQCDLTSSLRIPLSSGEVYNVLLDKGSNLEAVIKPYSIVSKNTGKEYRFDVLPADQKLVDMPEDNLRQKLKRYALHKTLESVKSEYDYILIDAPPNWRWYSTEAVYAADVVLIPTRHNNIFSLKNAARAITEFIPEARNARKDGSPVPLPIFFNGGKITPAARVAAYTEIDNLIKQADRQSDVKLLPYFYPRWTRATKDRRIAEIPGYANIANAAFAHIPAVYKDKTAREFYKFFAMEYFLQ